MPSYRRPRCRGPPRRRRRRVLLLLSFSFPYARTTLL
ncbi:hypothetical protein CN215_06980 [Sinorhizobium meliloti]|nr:hypothetical protein CN215_06980 [Sinorhizobium meliloti]